jgi:hypothetical protein
VSYALPAALHVHVQTVVPTTAFTSTRLLQQTPRSRSDGEAAEVANVSSESGEPSDVLLRRDDSHVEPSLLRWAYRLLFSNPAETNRNMLGIAGFGDEKPSSAVQWSFMTKFRTDADASAATRIVTVLPVNGGVNDQNPPGRAGKP